MKYTILILTVLLTVFSSCRDAAQEEQDLLQAYIEDNNITTAPTASGLYYIVVEEGTGEAPVYGSYVEVEYEGKLITGEIFDTSYEREDPFVFRLGSGQVIQGWEEGVSYMKVGGKAKLIIPSHLGYGSREMGVIPEYSTLVFDLELVSIGND